MSLRLGFVMFGLVLAACDASPIDPPSVDPSTPLVTSKTDVGSPRPAVNEAPPAPAVGDGTSYCEITNAGGGWVETGRCATVTPTCTFAPSSACVNGRAAQGIAETVCAWTDAVPCN